MSERAGIAIMPTYYYDGVPLHYRLSGHGEPVLLIHGLVGR
jgi:pimeloyl-ACP methyl ester carboxylesterase